MKTAFWFALTVWVSAIAFVAANYDFATAFGAAIGLGLFLFVLILLPASLAFNDHSVGGR